MRAMFGDRRGGHIVVFRTSLNNYAAFYAYVDVDAGGGTTGYGKTPTAAARDLWRKLHP